MGVVYRAYDAELGLDIALKALNDLGSESRSWLKAEFRSLSGIVHPNLVQLHELVIDHQRCFFTMELVRGLDLIEYFKANSEPTAPVHAHERWLKIARECGRQLAHAVASLHRAGKLHRDIKPSNVLVTDAGRVVLLDFGLVEPIPTGFDTTQGRRLIAGTLPYMSPEQTWGQRLTPASDWYAFGVTLFEALTGRLPIDGEAALVFAAKREQPGARPSRFVLDLPEDLDSLVARLLDPDPVKRPEEQEILETLGGTGVQGIVSVPPSRSERATAPFLGRDDELGKLRDAWATAQAGAAVMVSITGPSGIGKSELVRRFLETAPVAQSAMVLTGRCYPQESLPFNALDGVIEDLATNLARFSIEDLELIRPTGIDALTRLFPTLARVPTFVSLAPAPVRDRATPEVRRQAFAALKELLARLGRFKLPVLWLDDLQWADVDSAALLRDLLRGPERPALLGLLCLRAEDRAESAVLEALSDRAGAGVSAILHQLELAPLSSSHSLELIRELLPRELLDAEDRLRALYQEAGGSPFFLCELGRYSRSVGWATDPRVLRVEAMLEFRAAQLPLDTRRVLELVSVAGEPVEQRVVLRAAGLEPAQLPVFRTLEQLSFVRTAAGSERMIEVYHHRVRDHLLDGMGPELRRAHHVALARALLSAPNPNLQSVVEHSERGGDTAAVVRYIVPAARQAADAFAFGRAAALYRRALQLGVTDMDEAELRTQFAHALANAGHGREAAETYEATANLLLERKLDDGERLLALRRRAAEQFLQSGHDEKAVSALASVLSAHDLKFPKDRSQALLWATGLKLKTFMRPLNVKLRPAHEVPRQLLERFDALWAVTMRICMINHVQTGYLAVRCLEAALETREASRLALGMSLEAAALSMLPSGVFQRRAQAMLRMAEQLAAECGDYERALMLSGKGAHDWLRGDFVGALAHMDAASDLVRRSVQGVSWEHALFDSWALSALALLGRFRELNQRCRKALCDAEERDDRYLGRNVSLGEAALGWLAEDQPERALEMAERAIAWSPQEYTTQHYHHYVATAQIGLYQGDVRKAHSLSETAWPLLTSNMYLWNACVRDEVTHLRGRTALALAAALSPTAEERAGLIALARRSAKTLRANALPCGVGWALLLQAGASVLSSEFEQAEQALRHAAERFRDCGMLAYAAAARYCLGALAGSDEGAALMAETRGWFISEEVRRPERFIFTLAPACCAPSDLSS